jgi:hypothetical protein
LFVATAAPILGKIIVPAGAGETPNLFTSAMQRSVIIKALLKQALTHQIDDRALFMKGIDVSYFYEGYSQFKTEEL